jgi:hypothetical protein
VDAPAGDRGPAQETRTRRAAKPAALAVIRDEEPRLHARARGHCREAAYLNKALQATPDRASPAFGRSHRYGGALELRRYRASE